MNTKLSSPWRQWPPLMQVSLASLWRNKWASVTVALCVMLVVLVLPLLLAATAVKMFGPSLSGTDAAKLLLLSGVAMPLILTWAALSPTLPCRVSTGVFR